MSKLAESILLPVDMEEETNAVSGLSIYPAVPAAVTLAGSSPFRAFTPATTPRPLEGAQHNPVPSAKGDAAASAAAVAARLSASLAQKPALGGEGAGGMGAVSAVVLQDEVMMTQPRPTMDIFKAIFSDDDEDNGSGDGERKVRKEEEEKFQQRSALIASGEHDQEKLGSSRPKRFVPPPSLPPPSAVKSDEEMQGLFGAAPLLPPAVAVTASSGPPAQAQREEAKLTLMRKDVPRALAHVKINEPQVRGRVEMIA